MGTLWSFTWPQKALSEKRMWDSRAMLHFQPSCRAVSRDRPFPQKELLIYVRPRKSKE